MLVLYPIHGVKWSMEEVLRLVVEIMTSTSSVYIMQSLEHTESKRLEMGGRLKVQDLRAMAR